ncbi:uncharacterized protein N0V89_005418 [Didymosphaeria variabile]|uniref:F-box domain-containing protein n=1 Tax=Didymosphaeria variabile TaxID=1932322 RepID=A0A9W8XMU5_9PLEO|nr:uncharacterized protein N0V89_005418 [Didymosphaeria variabile]KAJ4353688.1 hypothetical protein N0V89_005418 [Didymosphaeria variabile]
MDRPALAPSSPDADLLSDLPTETITSICEYLDGNDMNNFRLASRTIHAKTYRGFFDYHFEVTHVTFTREGLERLVGFAKDPKISPSVKAIELILVAFPNRGKQCLTGKSVIIEERDGQIEIWEDGESTTKMQQGSAEKPGVKTPQKTLRRARRRIYSHYQHDLNNIRRRGVDVELLTEALRHLPALKNIWLVDSIPDYQQVWGLRKIIIGLGMMPFSASMRSWVPPKHNSYESRFEVERELKAIGAHGVGVVLGAIYRSRITFSGGLILKGVPYDIEFSKTPDSRQLSPSATPSKTFAMSQIAEMKYLSRIRFLHVVTFHYAQRRDAADPHDAYRFEWLYQILPSMISLEFLGIQCGDPIHEAANLGILEDLNQRSITLPKLYCLLMDNMGIETPALISFLDAHRGTLRRLHLDNINLCVVVPMDGLGDSTLLLLVPWLERNNWNIFGYCFMNTNLISYNPNILEFREGFRAVRGIRDIPLGS